MFPGATRELAERAGIPLLGLDEVDGVDLAIDGADEIGPGLALIKGGGGALLHEKLVATAARELLVVADASKVVARLGAFPLPIEIVPAARRLVAAAVRELGGQPALRGGDRPFRTDEGNHILDCAFGVIPDAAALAGALDRVVGVVEHGLFVGLAAVALVGDGATVRELRP